MRTILLWCLLAGIASAGIPALNRGVGIFAQPQGGGATLSFDYSVGFTSAGSNMTARWGATVNGSGQYVLTDGSVQHQANYVWYHAQLNVSSFTTEFTFQNQEVGGVPAYGMDFVIQNSNATTNPGNGGGTNAQGDSNGMGYFVYSSQGSYPPCTGTTSPYQQIVCNSVDIKFDSSSMNFANYVGSTYGSGTGLYMNGGPIFATSAGANGAGPEVDLTPYGINLASGDKMDAKVTYDGSILTMVLTDTVTSASARLSWPINIPAAVGSSSAWVGMTAGNVHVVTSPVTQQLFDSWIWYSGYNTELAKPTFNVAAGQYSTSQTVTISGPVGAAIHYTTDGTQPTSASPTYSAPITVGSTENVQAVALESSYTDSPVASAYYQIGTGTYPIDFSAGFTGSAGILNKVGATILSGSALQIINIANDFEVGAAWFNSPVTVSTFTSAFTAQFPTVQAGTEAGLLFVLQNYLPASRDANNTGPVTVTGGPLALGRSNGATSWMGYGELLESVGVKLDPANNTCGVYTDGASPAGAATAMTGINLASGHAFDVVLTYSGTTLGFSITDDTTSTNFTHNFTVDIPTSVGGSTAYVGFVGGENYAASGTQGAVENVTKWTYHN